MAAIAASGNRQPALANIAIPTLVLHGKADSPVLLVQGVDTHEVIHEVNNGSLVRTFERMGTIYRRNYGVTS